MATEKTPDLEDRVTTLEEQMAEVLAKPAFKPKTPEGVCALGHKDSTKCPEASLGRMQNGCHGFACLNKQRVYYQEYRARKAAEKERANRSSVKDLVKTPAKRSTKVANPRKKAEPKAKTGTIKRATPAKKAPARIKRRGA
jgi:hypothetical protein